MSREHIGYVQFEKQGSLTSGHFRAMANPCVIIIETDASSDAIQKSIRRMANEVWRIEQKYSRYLKDSVIGKINDAKGSPTAIDFETNHLLHLSKLLWKESDGSFDISSGSFRKIWNFNQQHTIPTIAQIKKQLAYIGWDKVKMTETEISLPEGMQLDFGGIGKEYAADRCASLASDEMGKSILVNLGGDVVALGPRADQKPWQVGIETKEGGGKVWKRIPLTQGAVATSGDVYKSISYKGKRYGHIINALTGYPVADSPSTVTVAAPNCTEAGMLTTLAILQGNNCETFLQEQGRPFWVQR